MKILNVATNNGNFSDCFGRLMVLHVVKEKLLKIAAVVLLNFTDHMQFLILKQQCQSSKGP